MFSQPPNDAIILFSNRTYIMYQPRHVANALITTASLANQTMSQMRLQKMLYIIHGVYSVWHKEPLLPEVFEAWQYGPAIDSILRGYDDFDPVFRELTNTNQKREHVVMPPKSDVKFWNTLQQVYRDFAEYSDHALSTLEHDQFSAWFILQQQGLLGETIPQALIVEHFEKHILPVLGIVKEESNVIKVDFNPY